jgi:3-oxoacyl-[acyl-carrier protein] reductase
MADERADARRVVVTGASGGLGSAVARRFLKDGAQVVNLDRAPPQADLMANPGFSSIALDISHEGMVRHAFEEADRRFGRPGVDALVHCAAISLAGTFPEIDTGAFDRVMAVNIRGTLLVCREAGRRMKAQRAGHIVVVTSVCAEQAWVGELAYSASKAAKRSLVQSMANDLAPFGVLVNALGPGLIEQKSQDMVSSRDDPEVFKHDMDRTPLGRFGDPDELAEAAHSLAAATWMTGQTMYVDGGFLAAGLAHFGEGRARLVQAAVKKS